LKDLERPNFTESFTIKPFQRDWYNESDELVSSVSKDNVSELELEVINLERDLSMERRVNKAHFWNLLPSAACPPPKRMS
jgi:hypothetical protein